MNVVNSFENSITNSNETITYSEDKNHIYKKKFKNYKMLTTILKSFDTFVINATVSIALTLSLTENGFDSITNIDWYSVWNSGY